MDSYCELVVTVEVERSLPAEGGDEHAGEGHADDDAGVGAAEGDGGEAGAL